MRRKFKNDYVGPFQKGTKNAETKSKKEYRMLQFSSESVFNESLNTLSNLKREEYPRLFIFSINIDNLAKKEKVTSSLSEALKNFGVHRPKMLILRSEKESSFLLGDEKLTEYDKISTFLLKFECDDPESFDDNIVHEVFNLPHASTVLRYIRSFEMSDELQMTLLKECIAKGSADNFAAILESSFEREGRVISESSEKLLSIMIESWNSSVLFEAVKNKNEGIVTYLISNWTHLIQQLPFDHRIQISTRAFAGGQYEMLCNLLEFSDFPFPKNLKDSPINDPRLRKIVDERTQFHLAISDGNLEKISELSKKFTNLKLVFNSDNETALNKTIESKQFKVYAHLKSYGFASEEFETDDISQLLTKEELKAFKTEIRDQTNENIKKSRKNDKSHLHLLITRSRIHDRMVTKQDEEQYREKIKKWFEDINNNDLCSKFLNVASQCLDLQLIFDFKSESVENVDLRNDENTSGSTYPISKRIFIGALETNKNPENKIKGVLIHEIGHYVMRLVYENNEEPYYKNDQKSKEEFTRICNDIDKWLSEYQLEHNEGNDEDNDEQMDEQIDEQVDDECEGNISTVYKYYEKKDFHAELIVRPLQTLAQFDGDDEKKTYLEEKYRPLFDYIENIVSPDLDSFNLQNREDIRKLNKLEKLLSGVEELELELRNPKISEIINDSKIVVVSTNVPKLFLCDLYNHLNQTEHLFDTKNVFTTTKMKDDDLFSHIFKDAVRLKSALRVIFYCADDFDKNVSKFIKTKINYLFVTSSAKRDEIVKTLELLPSIKITKHTVDYEITDLTQKSQDKLFKTKINFQQNPDSSLSVLFSNDAGLEHLSRDNFLDVVNNQLLNMLIEKSEVSLNSNFCDDISDASYNDVFQSRTFVKCEVGNPESGQYPYDCTDTKLGDNELLTHVEDMNKILIYDISGSGKSWILQKYANTLRKQYPNHFLMFVDLKNLCDRITDDPSNIWNFKNDFELKIFEKLCENGKVFILLDGFENISSSDILKTTIYNFIKKFTKNERNQLWITTRDCSMQQLLNTVEFDGVFKLDLFSNQDGINLISKLKVLADDQGIPTSSKVKDYQVKARSLCEQILRFNCHKIGLPQIYKIISQLKYSSKIPDKFLAFDILEEFIKNHWKKPKDGKGLTAVEIHQYFAIKNMFPNYEKYCDFKQESLDWTDLKLLTCGFLVKKDRALIIENGSIQDFFVADFIITTPLKSRSLEKSVEHFNNLVLQTLKDSNFGQTRMFLNGALANTEGLHKLGNVLKEFNEEFINNVDSLLSVAFKEDLVNIVNLLLAVLKEKAYPKVKEVLIAHIDKLISESTDIQYFKTYMKITMDFLNENDAKEFISGNKIFKELIRSNLDIEVYENLIEILKLKVSPEFVRQTLRHQEDNGTILHFLCRHKKFNIEVFAKVFKILKDLLENNEVVDLLNAVDENKMNVLQSCIIDKDKDKFKFIWEECQQIFLRTIDQEAFKAFVIENKSDLNILQIAAVHCNKTDFHQELWKLLMEVNEDQESLKCVLLQKDHNGDNFFHLLLKHQKFDLINEIISRVFQEFDNKLKIKEMFRSKNGSQKNLLHLVVEHSNDLQLHKFLWNKYKNLYTKNSEFLQILEDTDNKSNNIMFTAVDHSNVELLKFIMNELKEIANQADFERLLTCTNNDNKNIVQYATINSNSTEIHQTLWEIVQIYLEDTKIVQLIESSDNFGDNAFISSIKFNNIDVATIIWNQIVKVIDNTEELNKILDGAECAAQKNAKYPEISKWTEDLICEMLIKHPYGKPEKVLKFSTGEQIIVENSKLKELFDHPEVRDRKIVAFSIIGAFRKGKSFFLNYCLRYLYGHYRSVNYPENPLANPNEWMGDADESLKGFSWRSGSARDTRGITFWNDIFLHTNEINGEKIAIVVMDTQGLFDHDTSPIDNTRIFALSTLISSIQVLNLSGVIQEDQLQYLHFATEFAQVASEDTQDEKYFQKLMFLIRDWAYPNDYDYGIGGGTKYLEKILTAKENQDNELKSVRDFIHKTFGDLSCCLLLNPGTKVSVANKKEKKYKGNHGLMEQEFKDELINLIENLLEPKNLVTKKINQNELTGSEFLTCAEIYFEALKSKQVPNVKKIFETIIEKQMIAIVDSCVEKYKSSFNEKQHLITETNQIDIFHERSQNYALLLYNESNKVGKPSHAKRFKEILKLKLKTTFEEQRRMILDKIQEENRSFQAIIDNKDAKIKENQNELVRKDDLISSLNKNIKHEKQKCEELELQLNKFRDRLLEKDANFQELKLERDNLKTDYENLQQAFDSFKEKYNTDIVEEEEESSIVSNTDQQTIESKVIDVFKFTENNEIETDDDQLKNILEHPEIKDRKIVTISVVGIARKGKSFLLNYCLRYLYAHYPSINYPDNSIANPNDWMGNKDEPLTGFSWRSGSARDTSGIVMWNDAFLYTDDKTGDKVAIILIDTQGIFGSETLPVDDLRIFSLGISCSSILVLNMDNIIQKNQLEQLHYAINCATFITNENKDLDEKPLQNLIFLMRDWDNVTDYTYGTEGGNTYLNSLLKPKIEIKEFSALCNGIKNSFENISCSLIPSPNNIVYTGQSETKKYNGNWAEMDEEFRDELRSFIEYLFSMDNLTPKKENGSYLKTEDYLKFIHKCIQKFQLENFLNADESSNATINVDNNRACEEFEEPDFLKSFFFE